MDKEYYIKLTDSSINTLINDRNSSDEFKQVIKNIQDQRNNQDKFDNMFPHTTWNAYIYNINRQIIDMDSDRDKQLMFIMDTFNEMIRNEMFDNRAVVRWFNSQMLATGHPDMEHIYDYCALYDKNSSIDLSNLIGEIVTGKVK